MTEQQVIAIAGQPSRTVEPTDLCKRDGGVREMIYDDIMVDRLGLLSDQVIGSTIICLNASSIVVAKMMVDY